MQRNEFNLSHEHKLSADMGYLLPVCTMEVLPGDTFLGSTSAMLRIAPLAFPLMHRVEVRVHHWYVPNRLLWNGWEEMITGEGPQGAPLVTSGSASASPVLDHQGVPPNSGNVNATSLRGYNTIWNHFYRDHDLQTERNWEEQSLARIAWQKDYLTVARPQPQQGDPVNIEGYLDPIRRSERDYSNLHTGGTGVEHWNPDTQSWNAPTGGASSRFLMVSGNSDAPSLSVNIDQLRRSLALQRIAEARSMFGSRYVDYLRFLGVNPSDGRLDKPEYLGGGKTTLNFSEVLSTAEGTSTSVGDMTGHGIGAVRTNRFRKMFEEHGWFMSLLSVRPKTVYQDHLPRQFTRDLATDYWHKELETLPWQEVTEREVYNQGSSSTVFGYVPRYEEYRHGMSYVSGTLRGGTENDWTMARQFGSAPTLNGSFVECTPTDRVYQDTNKPETIISVHNNIQARRLVRSSAMLGGL
jgi:hypothetical protein